jgi:hypothetical protein
MLHGDRTALMAMNMAQAAELERLHAVRRELKDFRLFLRWRREMKYSPEQPRDADGRWMPWEHGEGDEPSSDGVGSDAGEAFGVAPEGTGVDAAGTSAFTNDQKDMTVQSFRSAYCLGSIREVLPGQFNDMTINQVINLAKQGDSSARRCLKILGQDRFRK